MWFRFTLIPNAVVSPSQSWKAIHEQSYAAYARLAKSELSFFFLFEWNSKIKLSLWCPENCFKFQLTGLNWVNGTSSYDFLCLNEWDGIRCYTDFSARRRGKWRCDIVRKASSSCFKDIFTDRLIEVPSSHFQPSTSVHTSSILIYLWKTWTILAQF